MSSDVVLVTGGAGFIGQHLCRRLLVEGYEVRILDNFSNQVHSNHTLPPDLADNIQVIRADIRDRDILSRAIDGANKVVHLAAETGTGQSMYQVDHYFSVNVQGTALLLDILANSKARNSISSLVVASSRAVYGEGQYSCAEHGDISPDQRKVSDMEVGDFEVKCPICGSSVELRGTMEASRFNPLSYYGLTKQIQEQAILMHASNYGINGIGLRYQNVYGPGQSLKNPYTGILAIFSNLARQSQDIKIFEDGLESRDFVYIADVVEATLLAIECEKPYVGPLNVGSGVATTVKEVAIAIKAFFNSASTIMVDGAFRIGDIRHNIADLALIKETLDYQPTTPFEQGLREFLQWAECEPVSDKSAYVTSVNELTKRGLMR